MIYTSAIYADPGHTLVTGTDANGNIETVPADHTVFRLPEHGPVGFVGNGGVIADYVAPDLPVEQLWGTLRAQRDARLAATDWLVQRHAEELTLDIATTLTPEQYTDLLTYRQALRDLPSNTTDPANPEWPVNPLGEP